MKTVYEIEQMKDEIGKKIENLSNEICNSTDVADITYKCDRSRQLQAQYNILLEVLK